MKKFLSIILAGILLITLTACSNSQKPEVPTVSSSAVSATSDVISDKQTEKEDEDINTVDTQKVEQLALTESVETTSATTEKEVKTTTEGAKQSTSTQENRVDQKEPKPQVTETTTEEKPKETEPIVEKEPEPLKPKAPSTSEVEQWVAEYINQYRQAQGDTSATVLTGLTQVARYRANQLTTNYAHINGRTVCAELKYGRYVDLTAYGFPESDNYYEGYDREAICKGDWGGTAEQIANNIATGFKNSSKHWNYVGDSAYGYMAVGIVYNEANQTWYCCICMSMENYGG